MDGHPTAGASASRSPLRKGRVGIIDVGSNSIRLVVYERASRAPLPVFNEKVLCGLARGLGGGLLRAGGLLGELRTRERVGGGIGSGIDAEKEVAGLHFGAFGVIDGLQDARDARADFHLADAFDLRRRHGLLGEVGRSDGDDGHGQRAGGRRSAFLTTADED